MIESQYYRKHTLVLVGNRMPSLIIDVASQVKYINIDPVYIPNTNPHQDKWNPKK